MSDKTPPAPAPPAPKKPGRWTSFANAIGAVLGEALFGGNR